MKGLVLAVIITLLALANLWGYTSQSAPSAMPDIPGYTTELVIYVAGSYSSKCGGDSTSSYEATYQGRGMWLVKKYCIDAWDGSRELLNSWYLCESTGRLISK